MPVGDQPGRGAGDDTTARTAPASLDPAAVRAQLDERTRAIIERPRPPQVPEQAQRERDVVRQCRYLMRLLATRRRSAGELRRRLAQREVPAAIAHEALERIDRAGLIDDAAFARDWVDQRRRLRALGDQALRRELEEREVAAEHIDAALTDGQDDQEQRCRLLVRSRLQERDRQRLRSERDGSHRRRLSRRLDALLTRKGYPGDLAVRVISGELRAAQRD